MITRIFFSLSVISLAALIIDVAWANESAHNKHFMRIGIEFVLLILFALIGTLFWIWC